MTVCVCSFIIKKLNKILKLRSYILTIPREFSRLNKFLFEIRFWVKKFFLMQNWLYNESHVFSLAIFFTCRAVGEKPLFLICSEINNNILPASYVLTWILLEFHRVSMLYNSHYIFFFFFTYFSFKLLENIWREFLYTFSWNKDEKNMRCISLKSEWQGKQL